MRKYLITLLLLCNISYADTCAKHRRALLEAQEICNVGTDFSLICSAATTSVDLMTGGTGLVGLICSLPGMITQMLCTRTEAKKHILLSCEKHERWAATQRDLNARGMAQSEEWARLNINQFITTYNNQLIGMENMHWFEKYIQSKINDGTDIESAEFVQHLNAMLKKDDEDKTIGLKNFTEQFNVGSLWWLDEIKQYGYTEWDSFINTCVSKNKIGRPCIKTDCDSKLYMPYYCKE